MSDPETTPKASSDTPRPPSVDKLARSIAHIDLPQPLLVDCAREAIAAGDPSLAEVLAHNRQRAMLQRVINATGTLLHTNLGRAPNGVDQEPGFRNLEFDLATGERGSRQSHAGSLLARACGAEAAIVVNNCASAVMLILGALAHGRGAVVSRGELVEIGGGFRVPDVMAQSGSKLIEVGTTNRTRRADYVAAIEDPANDVAIAMQIHQSNYRITGFTEMPTTEDLADLGVPLISDIGSGLLDAGCPWLNGPPPTWLEGEPAAKQTLEAGARLVAFSGDKLLGGPQAGIIAGDADLVAQCAKHPLARALRPGGLVLGALQQLALTYLARDGAAIPFWRMATTPVERLRARAESVVSNAGCGTVTNSIAVPGGGTLPTVEIPSIAIELDGNHRDALRSTSTPVIARVHEGKTICDLRSIEESDDAYLAEVLGGLAT